MISDCAAIRCYTKATHKQSNGTWKSEKEWSETNSLLIQLPLISRSPFTSTNFPLISFLVQHTGKNFFSTSLSLGSVRGTSTFFRRRVLAFKLCGIYYRASHTNYAPQSDGAASFRLALWCVSLRREAWNNTLVTNIHYFRSFRSLSCFFFSFMFLLTLDKKKILHARRWNGDGGRAGGGESSRESRNLVKIQALSASRLEYVNESGKCSPTQLRSLFLASVAGTSTHSVHCSSEKHFNCELLMSVLTR